MKPVLLSTAYLPPVSWIAAALQSADFDIEVHETYPKQTFRNRCNIATSSGILSLTVPVIRRNGNHTKTIDIGIDNSTNWQKHHWRSIVSAYSKSPYFIYYRDHFEIIYQKEYNRLFDLNQDLILLLFHLLKIPGKKVNTTLQYTISCTYQLDLRNSFQPKKKPYQALFPNVPRYLQVFEEIHGFLPDLSIIDLLFNLGPDSLHYLTSMQFSVSDPIKAPQDTQSGCDRYSTISS